MTTDDLLGLLTYLDGRGLTITDPARMILALAEQGTIQVFTTQDGTVFAMDGATCPRCGHASSLTHRHGAAGYFNCPECALVYDEPDFAESAYLTTLEDGGE